MDDCPDLARLAGDFLGLEQEDPVVSWDGEPSLRRRVYLDSAATTLMSRPVWRALDAYLRQASANSHTEAHRAGRDTTQAIEDSREAIGRLVGFDADTDVVLFSSNGATGAINFLARALFPPELRTLVKRFPGGPPPAFVETLRAALGPKGSEAIDRILERPLVVTTRMEHHSNLLPWMEAVGHHHVRAVDVRASDGTLDIGHLERILAEEGSRVRLLTVTGVSNVTGIKNPVHQLAQMAHAVGAQILVDGAQWVPHAPVQMHRENPEESIDYLVFSGHKLYAPGSRGALVGNLETLSGCRCVTDVGGGMVDYVTIEDFQIKDEVTAREEAGTPNIPGSIAMGLIAGLLMEVGMERVENCEALLTAKLLARLRLIPEVTIYGSPDLDRVPRAGVVAFNVEGMDHELVATYLNDFHDVLVRNGCFCAQPYAKVLMRCGAAVPSSAASTAPLLGIGESFGAPKTSDLPEQPGMVRASLGLYSTESDVELLGQALEEMIGHRDQIIRHYDRNDDGRYVLASGASSPITYSVAGEVRAWTQDAGSLST